MGLRGPRKKITNQKFIGTYVSERILRALDKEARDKSRSRSYIIRMALQAYAEKIESKEVKPGYVSR